MILVIDTSSALSAVALLGPSGEVVREATFASGRTFDLPAAYRSLGAGGPLSRVAVATGPGSFTGLRVGVSFGVGLAMGLRIPIVPLPTLAIQAARCERPVIAVAEAGRGRVYFQIPGAEPALAEPSEVPGGLQAVGWLRPATELAMAAAGHPLVALTELDTFGVAAGRLLKSAPEAAYGSVKIAYMQSFAARA